MKKSINIERLSKDERKDIPTELVFGATFSDHMFQQTYNPDLGWHDARIEPLRQLTLHPASAVFHYGQEIFEGLKAYKRADGEVNLFRPEDNFRRFNNSARTMVMPEVDVDFHLRALKELIKQDLRWVPKAPGSSLYIRPTMIATTPKLGLSASTEYLHYIITSPVGPYFSEGFNPISVYVSDSRRRAVEGGVGEAKTGGNYAASLGMSDYVAKRGYSQVLWLDAIDGKYVEEVGAMNICFVYDHDKIVTPQLSGSILPGITRDSVLQLGPTLGYKVSEARLDVNDIVRDIKAGKITEVFGCGTAAVIAPIGKLHFKGSDFIVNEGNAGSVSKTLLDELTGIQYGSRHDIFSWTQTLD